MKSASIAGWSLLTSQAILLSGCTDALWEKDRFARYHQPATPSHLQLFHSAAAEDILVRYPSLLCRRFPNLRNPSRNRVLPIWKSAMQQV